MEEMSFWDHLEALRGVIFRSLGAVVVLAVVFFVFIIAVCIETVHTYSLVKNIINSDKSLF